MAEYDRIQKKQESRSIANSKLSSRQLKGFVDNRPQAVGQARTIELIQKKSNKALIQLASPLVRGKLNVVGEDHIETEGRLRNEKRYTRENAGSSNYWRESDFRVRDFKITDWWEDKRPRADPFELRFNSAQKLLELNSKVIKEKDYVNDQQKYKNDLYKQCKFIQNLRIYILNLSNGTDGFEVSAARKTQMLSFTPTIQNIGFTWNYIWRNAGGNETSCLIGFNKGSLVDGSNDKKRHFNSVSALTAINPTDTRSKINSDRAQAMHIAANNRSTHPGVWKVGDVHVTDMNALGSRNYNLVSKDNFNVDYNSWILRNP